MILTIIFGTVIVGKINNTVTRRINERLARHDGDELLAEEIASWRRYYAARPHIREQLDRVARGEMRLVDVKEELAP